MTRLRTVKGKGEMETWYLVGRRAHPVEHGKRLGRTEAALTSVQSVSAEAG